ncbi:MAG: hypothetical protein XXXJIFNMEKO3_LKCDNKCA_00004 (plasmid) [Candidatus Erwinia impunctatus]
MTHDRPVPSGTETRGMTKPQRKRLTRGRECERVPASGFSRPLFMDRNRAVSVTAKVNTADNGGQSGHRKKPVYRLSLASVCDGQ